MALCLLSDGGFPKSLWGEMFFPAAFLADRAPHKALGNEMPYKGMHGRDANLRMMRAIGARAFVYVEIYIPKHWPPRRGRVNVAITARIVELTVYTTRRQKW